MRRSRRAAARRLFCLACRRVRASSGSSALLRRRRAGGGGDAWAASSTRAGECEGWSEPRVDVAAHLRGGCVRSGRAGVLGEPVGERDRFADRTVVRVQGERRSVVRRWGPSLAGRVWRRPGGFLYELVELRGSGRKVGDGGLGRCELGFQDADPHVSGSNLLLRLAFPGEGCVELLEVGAARARTTGGAKAADRTGVVGSRVHKRPSRLLSWLAAERLGTGVGPRTGRR